MTNNNMSNWAYYTMYTVVKWDDATAAKVRTHKRSTYVRVLR